MKTLLQGEYIALFVLGIYLFYTTGLSRWWFIGLLFVPDISMIGYLLNNKVGAIMYNLFHHLGLATILIIIGLYFNSIRIEFIGIILFSHIALDRIFGYGLKYNDSFQHTHLGILGKK